MGPSSTFAHVVPESPAIESDAAMVKKEPSFVTWKQIGVILSAIAAATVVHSYLVVPRIIQECRDQWRSDFDIALTPVVRALDKLEERIK